MRVRPDHRRNLSTGWGPHSSRSQRSNAQRLPLWIRDQECRHMGAPPAPLLCVQGQFWRVTQVTKGGVTRVGVLDTCSKRARESDPRWRSGTDHRNGGHTDADFDTPIDDPRWTEPRGVARKCRLPKPAILRTIDAPGRRLEGRVACTHGTAVSRPAGRERRRRTSSARLTGARCRMPRPCPAWQIDLSQQLR